MDKLLILALSAACLLFKPAFAGEVPRSDPADQIKFEFQGRERWAVIHLPQSYDGKKAVPVVLVFHGGGGFPDAVRFQSQMDTVSDREGFIAVYPAGSGIIRNGLLSFNSGICCGYALDHKIDDVGFTSALIDELAKRFNIDSHRIYSTGLSNGAMMSYRLACELSDRIAAIAPVATALGVPCNPKRPISIMHFHGLEDQNALFYGGVGPKSFSEAKMPSVPDTIKFWANLDGCPKTSKETSIGVATRIAYGPCKDNTEVVLWKIADGGHTWPGGKISRVEDRYGLGKVNRDINASELMWDFFKKHPMTKKADHK